MTTEQIALSEERLRELLAGCDGVTPGPWTVWGEFHQWFIRELGISFGRVDRQTNAAADAAHAAACDPQTVRSLVTELLALREAVKPFAALGQYILDEDLQTKPDDRPIWGFDRHELTYGDFRAAAKAARALSHPEPMK